MRVLHIITGLGVGGTEVVLVRLLAADQSSTEHHVVSLASRGPVAARLEALGISVTSLDLKNPLRAPWGTARLVRESRRFGPDLVQGWLYHGNLAALIAAGSHRTPPPVIWNIRQSAYGLRYEKAGTRLVIGLGSRTSGIPAAIVYNSETSCEQHEELGYVNERTRVIANGFDLAAFAPSPSARTALRAHLGLPSEALLVGHLARYHPKKGHELFLEAAANVARRIPGLHFVLAGREVASRFAQASVIRDLNLSDRFHFLGEVQNVPDVLAGIDIFCLSSVSESFPNALGEAMSCGAACVATDVGDVRSLLGESGKLVPPDDAAALAEGILALAVMDSADRGTLGRAARARIAAEFSLESMVGGFAALHAEVMGQ